MSSQILKEGSCARLERKGRFLISAFNRPHRVLSTCFVNGGLRENLSHIVNHQCVEGKAHPERGQLIHELGRKGYHDHTCGELDLVPETTALMSTAANMQYAGISEKSFGELSITAVATAGVTGNAARAGDPACWDERDGEWEKVVAEAGTINIILLCNQPLSPAAFCRAVITMTEAKSAVLQELSVGSRSSGELATGTGTDQFCLAAPLGAGERTWTGQHTKAGELIGCTVKEAVRESLRWQNGLEYSLIRSLYHALGRHGLTEERLRKGLARLMDAETRELLLGNMEAVIHDPQASACTYAIATVLDRIRYGTFPPQVGRELTLRQCALLASSISGKPGIFEACLLEFSSSQEDVVDLIVIALGRGFSEKWK
ncbi:MAG: adenosylcobinamide amidohydrolase [Planctomycetes bacterium]|nr:adenosylcobinamide amidohydrolase [Planctomycetota bacterium]